MTRVAVIGANGQVGAEVCLLLANHPEIEVIPICRNPAGSSFLRYHGLECRHGAPGDPAQAAELLAGSDVVLNFALALGLPRHAHELNRRLIDNSFRLSGPDAKNIYFSTMAVYGKPGRGLGVRTAYARDKLSCERHARRQGAETGKPVFVFRLGHVCGDLQNLTTRVRKEVASGPLALRRDGRDASNTVYTASIVEAVLQAIEGRIEPGTHDLATAWSWRDVYAHEARETGRELELADSASSSGGVPTLAERARRALRAPVRAAQNLPILREGARTLLSRLPERLNGRLNALHYQSRARAEIQALTAVTATYVDLPDPWTLRHPVPSLSDPAKLRSQKRYRIAERELGFH